jgi:hypothetical protein
MKILIAFLSLALAACSQEPSVDVIRGALEQSVHALPDSSDALDILSVTKTDSKTEGHYFYYYQAVVKFPNGFRAHCLAELCTRYDPLGVTNNLQPQPPGTTVTFRGILEFEKRDSGWVPVGGHLPDVLSVLPPASADSAPPAQPIQPAAAVSWSDAHGPLVNVGVASGGNCAYRWDGRTVSESEILTNGVSFLESAIRRLGGPANLTEENMPVAYLQFNEDAPYRCVRATIRAIQRSGFAELRIDDPQPGADPWVQPLDFNFDESEPAGPAPIEPVRNRVGLGAGGLPSWNGTAVNFVTLRQYLDLTETMNPVPLLLLQIGDAAPYRQVRPLLGVAWRSRASRIELNGIRMRVH